MSSRTYLFTTFCLVLLVGILQFYSEVEKYFSPEKQLRQKVSSLNQDLERERLKVMVAQRQFADYETQVASMLPLGIQGGDEQSFRSRSIASVASGRVSLKSIDLSSVILARAKTEFQAKNYRNSIRELTDMIAAYPASPVITEAYFFLAESYYLNDQPQECLEQIDRMMQLFPDSELTGFIMVRMGQILNARNRREEAIEVFRTIRKEFSYNKDLVKQTESLLVAQGVPVSEGL